VSCCHEVTPGFRVRRAASDRRRHRRPHRVGELARHWPSLALPAPGGVSTRLRTASPDASPGDDAVLGR